MYATCKATREGSGLHIISLVRGYICPGRVVQGRIDDTLGRIDFARCEDCHCVRIWATDASGRQWMITRMSARFRLSSASHFAELQKKQARWLRFLRILCGF